MGVGCWRRAPALALLLVGCNASAPVEASGLDGTTGTASTTTIADEGTTDPRTSDGATEGGTHEGSSAGETHDVADEESTGEPIAPELDPPYPIVLTHGFFGFNDFAGAGFVDYYWKVVEHLEAEGEMLVFTPAVDPFNDSTFRGEQLLAHVEEIVASTGYPRVNLIGHSQGGLDARVVASLRPDLVASVTTIATPHHGTRIADIVLGLASSSSTQAIADALVQLIGAPLWDEVGEETSVIKSLEQLSEPGMLAFNETYPDAPGVPYFSITGRTALHLGGNACKVASAPDFITDFEDTRDPVDPLLALTESVLSGINPFSPVPNDGLVVVGSAKWGTFLGCIPADHLDEIGHLFGTSPGLLNDWKYLAFYADLVEFLRVQGL
jgi:triacylglycerol lipase